MPGRLLLAESGSGTVAGMVKPGWAVYASAGLGGRARERKATMVTLRYTPNGGYTDADSVALDTSFFNDLSHDYSVELRLSEDFLSIRDTSDGRDTELRGDGDVDLFSGFYFDLSDITGSVAISAAGGDDLLIGGSNDDFLSGLAGDDILIGGAGADTLNGGKGFDTVSYANAVGSVTISDFFLIAAAGDAVGDTYTDIEAFVGSDLGDTFALSTTVTVEGGGGADTFLNFGNMAVSYEHSNAGVTVDLSGTTAGSGGDAEGDTYFGITRLFGSHYDDTLVAGPDASVLKGYGGLDTIVGGSGDDTIAVTGKWAAIDGGDGFDRLFVRDGEGSPNGIVPGAGTLINVEKVVVASGAALDLSEQSAIDGLIKVNSRAGDFSTVIGTQFDDRIVGGAGSDFLAGVGGHDRLSGGQGSDIFGFFGLGQQGVITDFSGHNGDQDKIFLPGGTAPAFVEAFSGDGSAEVRAETRAPGVQVVFVDYDGDGRSDASFRVLATDAITADDFYAPPPFGGPGSSSGALATSHAFTEALATHDIAGLI